MFGAKYSRLKFWIWSIILLIPFSFISVFVKATETSIELADLNLSFRFLFLLVIVLWMNSLANRIRDYGSNPWISLFALIPLVNIGLALYYGIAKSKNNDNVKTDETSLSNAVYNHSKDIVNDIKPAINEYKEKHSTTKNENQTTKIINLEINEDEIYEKIMIEIEEDKKIKSTWAKALAQSDGDDKKAESLYIKFRFEALIILNANKNELEKNKEEDFLLNSEIMYNDKKESFIKMINKFPGIKLFNKYENFKLPPSSFFQNPPKDNKSKVSEAFIDQKIADLLDKLAMFKIDGDVVRTYTGPVVTTFEFKPAPNVKVSKILGLQDDLAMALKAQTIRIQAPIPGKDVVGIEVPNEDTQTIYLKEMLDSDIFQNSKSPLTMILGKDIVGKPFITDLKKLPHLLIAGTTGSGKSVGINSMILSLLYKNSPDNLRLVMIDPKMLEFSMYNDIPHLLTPVITKAADAINALANMVSEMERRYTLMSKTKTKNIENYNEKAQKEGYDTMPYIVVVIDELADLMMTSGKDVEYSIARLAQMARASGIHLIVATQRPSVDVVTGLIKANLPSRLSYKVGQKIDSKIILDSMGAESLLGRGDMLFTPPGMSGLVRIHAPWSTESEIEKVVEFLKEQNHVEYDMNFIKNFMEEIDYSDFDELYEEAKKLVLTEKKTSISYIQEKLPVGYARATNIIEQLDQTGVLFEVNYEKFEQF